MENSLETGYQCVPRPGNQEDDIKLPEPLFENNENSMEFEQIMITIPDQVMDIMLAPIVAPISPLPPSPQLSPIPEEQSNENNPNNEPNVPDHGLDNHENENNLNQDNSNVDLNAGNLNNQLIPTEPIQSPNSNNHQNPNLSSTNSFISNSNVENNGNENLDVNLICQSNAEILYDLYYPLRNEENVEPSIQADNPYISTDLVKEINDGYSDTLDNYFKRQRTYSDVSSWSGSTFEWDREVEESESESEDSDGSEMVFLQLGVDDVYSINESSENYLDNITSSSPFYFHTDDEYDPFDEQMEELWSEISNLSISSDLHNTTV